MSEKTSKVYRVLYRKWRPKLFDDVVGQSHVTSILKNQIVSNRISHALMFCGTRGTGKTSCAKIFAKAVNCLNNVDGNPCLKCDICKKIENGNILDVYEIDAASNNGVENIRAIKEESNLVSSETNYKVYIVDEFHMLSTGAFNAFLRTLEEPPKNVIFILATTEFNKIPKTIISRCQKFDFRKIDTNSMVKRLKFVSEIEKIKISDGALTLICKNSDGSMRDALSILDQCSGENYIDEKKIRNTLGISNFEYLESLIENLSNCDFKKSVEIIENLWNQGKNLLRECESIMNYFFDIFFYHCSKQFLDNSLNNHDSILKSSIRINLNDSIKCFRILEKSYLQMSQSINKKADLEISMIEICQFLKKSTSEEKNVCISQALNSEEENLKSNPIEQSNSKTEERVHNDSFLECWDEILELIRDRISSSLFAMLKNSRAQIDENNLIVDTNNSTFDRINKYRTEVESIIEEKTGKHYRICMGDVKNKFNIDSFIDKISKYGIDVKIN